MEHVKKFVWPLLGVGLVVAGCFLMYVRKENEGFWYFALVLVGLAMIAPDQTARIATMIRDLASGGGQKARGAGPEGKGDSQEIAIRAEEQSGVIGWEEAKGAPPAPDEWSRVLRPLLHQVSYYTAPTYYLNVKLQVIDWNTAFEVVFADRVGGLRDKHVNYFIAELANCQQVFEHAREFTAKVHRGELPLVDTEELVYQSAKYGRVTFLKVAVQLHDAAGQLHGWAVTLLIREIDWGPFQRDLAESLRLDKMWSLYSASYDRVLQPFPPYGQLIADAVAVVPGANRFVADLGAGTGNVTAALLKARHRVTAVENNVAMLDQLWAKHYKAEGLTVVKSSVERLQILKSGSFDAAILVNVLYAVSSPLACLQEVHRILKPGGVLAFTTTYEGGKLDKLLDAIRAHLEGAGLFGKLARDYERLREVNKFIEATIAGRHTIEQYSEWTKIAGFQMLAPPRITYEDAVILVHARKTDPPAA